MIHPIVLVNAVLALAVAGAAYVRLSSSEPTPADLFMQSVATEDGVLGWSQLCPDVQAQIPRDLLEQHTQQLRATHADTGVTLTVAHIGDWPRTDGGQIRVYVATETDPAGTTGQKTYVLQTEANGCVESVQ